MTFPLLELVQIGKEIIDKFIADPQEKAKAALELEKLAHERELKYLDAQLQVATEQSKTNQQESQHPHIFVSGWRPFIGWVCGVCLALYYGPQFILASIMWVNMCVDKNELLHYPVSVEDVLILTLNMLGLGLIRTAEKMKKVASI